MGSKPTIAQVAERAGVTSAVVSRVLNHDATLQIRNSTRDRVLAAARELDYVPNHTARALRRRRTNIIGLGVHEISNPIYAEIIAGAQRAADECGRVVMLADVEALTQRDSAMRAAVQGGAIDGLLLQPAGRTSDQQLIDAATGSIPTVLLNERSKQGSVGLDDRAASRLATRHLIDLGHTRIGHLAVDGPSRSLLRMRGWRDEMRRSGLDTDGLVVPGGHAIDPGFEGMQRMLALPLRPTAVYCANILSATGAAEAIHAAGLRLGRDISLVGLHDFAHSSLLAHPVTTVRLPLGRLGEAAVRLLVEMLEGAPPRRVILRSPAPQLIDRGSTGPVD